VFSEKNVEKVKVLLTRTRITGALREDKCIFLIISRLVLRRMRNVSVKNCRENFVFNNFFFLSKIVPIMRQCGKIL